MIASADLDALRAAAGEDAVAVHDPLEQGGAKLAVTLAPDGAAGVGGALRTLGARGLAALVRGGGTKLHLGNAPRRADVFLSTRRLGGVLQLDADDGVVEVRAGTPLHHLRAAARDAGWDVGLEAAHADATVGGVLASGERGLRAMRFGRPRDAVLGLEVVLGTGEVTRCGGRVVKNVTGYDLAKLYVGSLGTLGVVTSAWLRLRPLPRLVRVLVGPAPAEEAAAVAAARALAGLASARAVALVDAGVLAPRRADTAATGGAPARPAAEAGAGASPGLVLLAELAGDEALVDAECARAEALAGVVPGDPELLARAHARQAAPPDAAHLRFRVHFRPSRAAAAVTLLRRAGAEVIAQPHAAEASARFALGRGDEPAVAAVLRAVRESVHAGEGHAVLEAAPAWVKAGRDVFGAGPADAGALALARAVKARFDPHGVLAPGRFAGGL